LDVQHKPTVEQEQTFIHTGVGDQTEVVCIVHASPRATVTWLKDGQVVDTAANVINQRGNKHSLTLVDIDANMFGTYTCKATNRLGSAEKTTEISVRNCTQLHHANSELTFEDIDMRIILSGPGSPSEPSYETLPETTSEPYEDGSDVDQDVTVDQVEQESDLSKAREVVIKTEAKGSFNDRYKMDWTAMSKTPITTFKIEYKAQGDRQFKELEVGASSLADDYWTGSHFFRNLRSATAYTVRIKSRNTFGYNDYGEEFSFATKGADPVYSAVSSAPSWMMSSVLVMSSILTLLLVTV
jgi:hypothetical protein